MLIRCLARKDGELFIAMSLDFGLAAQATSLEEAKAKLNLQIVEYIADAHSIDSKHREELLARKGPLSWYFLFYLGVLFSHIDTKRKQLSEVLSAWKVEDTLNPA